MTPTAELVKTSQSARSADEILQSSVSLLLGVTPDAATALASLDIKTVFDVPGDAIDRPADVAIQALARQPIAILRRIGVSRAPGISAALDTPTIRDLALWPPYRAAREILAEAFFPEQQTGFDADAPLDLLPQAGSYPTERVFYKRLLIDATPPTPQSTKPIEQADPIDVLPNLLNPTGFQRLATGALLTFSQSWFSQGLTLGQLLHSTSLAPGESTRIALVDWVRRSRAAASEDISEAEQLSNSEVHSRALNEVTSATATELQTGSSFTTSKSTTAQSGSGFGLDIGPLAIGGSGGRTGTTGKRLEGARVLVIPPSGGGFAGVSRAFGGEVKLTVRAKPVIKSTTLTVPTVLTAIDTANLEQQLTAKGITAEQRIGNPKIELDSLTSSTARVTVRFFTGALALTQIL